ncbi:MAG TPA: Spy/CpxP family protein refolding chaperone, partial [Xanthobacteraceae bacterium]
TVRPTAAQRDRLDALKNAAAQAADRLRATCLTEMPVTPSARLAAIEERLVAMLEAIQSVRGALAEFYGALSDEQKAQFNAIGRAHTRR